MSMIAAASVSDYGLSEGQKTAEELRQLAIRPRMKLFFSADIVGSTAFKQSFKLEPHEQISSTVWERKRWQNAIEGFYDRIKERFPVNWSSYASKIRADGDLYDILAGESPRFWKTVGDEALFWKEVTHEAQLWIALAAWLDTIAELRTLLKADRLDVKSAVWICEFPVRNCALVTRNDERKTVLQLGVAGVQDPLRLRGTLPGDEQSIDDNQQIIGLFYDNPYDNSGNVDFIGPGIDVGFRISSFASPRRLVLSVDVAYLLALSRINIFGTTSKPFNKTADGYALRSVAVKQNMDGIEENIKYLAFGKDFASSSAGNAKFLYESRLNFSGAEPLKGVLGGIKYPIFWIDITETDSYEYHKQKMYLSDNGREAPTWGQLFRYCRSFYDERKDFILPPIVLGKSLAEPNECIAWSSTCDTDSLARYAAAYKEAVSE